MFSVSEAVAARPRIDLSGSDFLEAVFETTPECIKVVRADGVVLRMNAAGLSMVGAGCPEEALGQSIFPMIAPEHRDEWRCNHDRVCAGERLSWSFDIIGFAGGRRSMESNAAPLVLPSGDVAHLGVTRDVTARNVVEASQRALVDELNHRVKNTLATVQSIAAQTLRGADSLPAFRDAFEARLMALSRAHDLLTRGRWTGADLAQVVRANLEPVAAGRFAAQGPAVRLQPRAVLALGLVFHELAVNAARHGALSNAEGRVDVTWRIDEGEVLALEWTESGGPAVPLPGPRGFGQRLIEQGAARDLQGSASLDFSRSGLRCRLAMSLRPVAASPCP